MSREKRNISHIDYAPIVFTDDEVDHARGVVGAGCKDAEDAKLLLDYLGLMPDKIREWSSDGAT